MLSFNATERTNAASELAEIIFSSMIGLTSGILSVCISLIRKNCSVGFVSLDTMVSVSEELRLCREITILFELNSDAMVSREYGSLLSFQMMFTKQFAAFRFLLLSASRRSPSFCKGIIVYVMKVICVVRSDQK